MVFSVGGDSAWILVVQRNCAILEGLKGKVSKWAKLVEQPTFDGHSRNLFGHFDQTSHVNGRGLFAQGTAFSGKEVPLSLVE
jgi:hypothetical protein